MQHVYLDITAEQLVHNRVLQWYLTESDQAHNVNEKYHRIYLQNDSADNTKQLLVQMTIEESVHWVLKRRKYLISQLIEPEQFYLQLWERVQYIQPQLELFVQHDMDTFYSRHHRAALVSWNMEGYLLFAAKKLKWTVETIMQDVYQSCRDEQEREEFIALLQFCAATQQSLLDDVYVTLEKERFTMVDVWGNDLQQIYLETLPAEEYRDVQMHDLLLSILMTMMPKNIHLFAAEELLNAEEQLEQQKLLELLRKIFGDRISVSDNV